jgi:hypothetical protein
MDDLRQRQIKFIVEQPNPASDPVIRPDLW